MKYIFVILAISCVKNMPDESVVPTPEQMPEGRRLCKQMCANNSQKYYGYAEDGRCYCYPKNN